MSAVGSESVTPIQEPRIRIKLGRGVVGYVRRRGGRLFVWSDPFGCPRSGSACPELTKR